MKSIKKLLFVFLFMFAFSLQAQTSTKPKYKIVGNEIVKIEKEKAKQKAEKTPFIHKIKGVKYSVWKSPRGSFYIWRTSKKTQKKYKQYLKI